MKASDYEKLTSVVDLSHHVCSTFLESEAVSELRAALQKVSRDLPGLSLSLNCVFEVFDEHRPEALPLLNIGLTTSDGREPYIATGDSTDHRYVTDDGICQLPHDRCPLCWGEWDFKIHQTSCSSCGASLGKDVKLLLDSDVCPHCERGTVSRQNPVCDDCGFTIDPDVVVWG